MKVLGKSSSCPDRESRSSFFSHRISFAISFAASRSAVPVWAVSRPSRSKTVAILHQHVPHKRQLRFLPFPLAIQARFPISCRFVCRVAPFLTVKIHRGIALVITSFVKQRVFLRESFSLLAHASMSVPSTVKCSSLNNPCWSISFSTPKEECFGGGALQSAGSFGQSPHGSS